MRLHSLALRLSALGACLLLSACSGISAYAQRDLEVDLAQREGYAWLEMRANEDVDGTLGERLRAAADAHLARLGMAVVGRDEAQLLARYQLEVEDRTRPTDPYFGMPRAERFERGVLTLTLLDPVTIQPVWRGRAQAEVRVTARDYGTQARNYKDTDDIREWRIEEMVAAALAPYPDGRSF